MLLNSVDYGNKIISKKLSIAVYFSKNFGLLADWM